MKVAVIDDDPVYRFVSKNMLAKVSDVSDMQLFEEPESALDNWLALDDQTGLPDVILIDINMNLMDGWDFLDKMKAKFGQMNRTRIYMVSSSPLESDVKAAKSHPLKPSGYMIKPMTMKKIGSIVGHDGSTFLELMY